ncbi:MAG: Plug domain-containing protein, partial [Candidatus Thiodiazotropha sp. (ex. Lucinisca nassula)]|nr:Plug domain-containing protein [Candidatus Thiodiazotropha sp. (ex. Lucinisca nassula)]
MRKLGLSIIALLSGIASADDELDSITVYGSQGDAQQSQNAESLRKGATNSTLGGYLDSLPNVDSASYGEAVGRPVIRGMSGYRVKILHNDNHLSDLSAMSQDHAVAVAPRASERIQLLKGPASLLYAAQ